MSIAIPETPPLIWIRSAPAESVTYEFYLQVCDAYIDWCIANGLTAQWQEPTAWLQSGDLQSFCNVVSKWPNTTAQGRSKPTLYAMLDGLRMRDERDGSVDRTFKGALDDWYARIRTWMVGEGMDPDNPNESRDERAARKNREAVAKHRLLKKVSLPDEDPDLHAAQVAVRNYALTKVWYKEQETEAKSAYEAAVARAKLARIATVDNAKEWLSKAAIAASTARDALDSK